MDTYEVLSLLFLGGSFLLALLAYIDRINKRKQRIKKVRTGESRQQNAEGSQKCRQTPRYVPGY